MRTAADIQIDEYTAIKMMEKSIRDGAMNYGKDEFIIAAGPSDASMTDLISTVVAGLCLGLASVLAGTVFFLAART